jgi:hypothetical protein
LSGRARDAVVVGLGQLGQLFSIGALKLGRRVSPLLRDSPTHVLDNVDDATPILACTPETALADVVKRVPRARRDDLCLVQNELFPKVWRDAGLEVDPTVIVFWHAKKANKPILLGNPTQVHGRHAPFVKQVHEALQLPCEVLEDEAARDAALVAKFALILAINALGLVRDVTLGAWRDDDPATVDVMVDEARRLGEAHLGRAVDHAAVRRLVQGEMDALREYPAKGRTAAARVQRAQADAEALGVDLGSIGSIAA